MALYLMQMTLTHIGELLGVWQHCEKSIPVVCPSALYDLIRG